MNNESANLITVVEGKAITKPRHGTPASRRPGNRGEGRHSPRRLVSVEKQAEALVHRGNGHTYAQIAVAMGLESRQAAWYCVHAALQRTPCKGTDHDRALDLARLEALFIPVYGQALSGDLMAVNAMLQIMERRAKLLGLDAPVRTEVIGQDVAVLAVVEGVLVVGATMTPEAWVAAVTS